jgi:hypothetical protein
LERELLAGLRNRRDTPDRVGRTKQEDTQQGPAFKHRSTTA